MREIRWHGGNKILDEKLKEIEKTHKIKLPDEYSKIVLNFDAAQPEVKNDKGEWKTGVIKVKHKREREESFSFISIINNFNIEEIKRYFFCMLPTCEYETCYLQFARNGNGSFFIFEFKKDLVEPKIYFALMEEFVVLKNMLCRRSEEFREEYFMDRYSGHITEAEWKEDAEIKKMQEDTLYFVANSFTEFLEMIEPSEY